MEDHSSTFKVIIIGAGVTGLTLAHCLAKAGIDYVLLDKGIVAPSFGTTITLQPHGCRILHQLGCLDPILASCDVMGGAQCRDPSGKSFASNDFFRLVSKLYVIPFTSHHT
jgi:2-polyprenyl-6-methoxyphenol hydroxylase-like FAD-dependent oxidoreductase